MIIDIFMTVNNFVICFLFVLCSSFPFTAPSFYGFPGCLQQDVPSFGASQVVLVVKNPPANAGDKRCRFDPWVRKIPWSKKWQPTPVFLLGKFHGQRSLVGYSPRGHKESDTTERLTLSLSGITLSDF